MEGVWSWALGGKGRHAHSSGVPVAAAPLYPHSDLLATPWLLILQTTRQGRGECLPRLLVNPLPGCLHHVSVQSLSQLPSKAHPEWQEVMAQVVEPLPFTRETCTDLVAHLSLSSFLLLFIYFSQSTRESSALLTNPILTSTEQIPDALWEQQCPLQFLLQLLLFCWSCLGVVLTWHRRSGQRPEG